LYSCFAEIYSTGKAKYVCFALAFYSLAQPRTNNRFVLCARSLPGSRRERQLLRSFARMAPELLRHCEKPELAERFSTKLRSAHRPGERARQAPRATAAVCPTASSIGDTFQSLWEEDDTCKEGNAGTLLSGSKRKRTEPNNREYNDEEDCEENEEIAFGAFFEGF
jgi:hypothetical protein